MRFVMLLLLSLVFCGSPVCADAFASSDLHPIIRVHAMQSFEISFNRLVLQDQDFFISRGGSLLYQEVSQIDGGPFISILVRGVGELAELAALKRVLAENRVGTLMSCEFADGAETREPYELNWYGRDGRRNSFVAVSGPAGASGFPPCPPQVGNIIRAIGDYRIHVVNLPGTEVLQAR